MFNGRTETDVEDEGGGGGVRYRHSCFGASSINGATDPSDASALSVMFTALNSPSQLTKWSANPGDPCVESWKGITCSGNRVTEIKLSGLGLSGSLGYQLQSLTAVFAKQQVHGNIDVLANLPLKILKGGNSWSSGPAPPPPPGTPQLTGPTETTSLGGGAIAGIVISILVVGAVVAFFIVKRRSKRSSADIENLGNQPFSPLGANEVQDLHLLNDTNHLMKMISQRNLSLPRRPYTTPIKCYIIFNSRSADGYRQRGGPIGRVYRAQFDDGKVVAVKKINSSALPNHLSEDFVDIVSDISRLHHPNITELVEHGQHLLVYEFHKQGSLHEYLHLKDEYSEPLTWNSRVKIALGTARALEYLHEVCSPSVVHKNIKSANILLDMEMNPHLSDSGLASFISDADQALNHNAGSGYSAPEVAMSGQYNMKSDVYSFGVVMLELLTGRKPFDSSRPRTEQSLVRWATPQLHDIDALSKMVDPGLKGLYPIKSLSRFADVIALCVQPEPEFRPPMSEVVQALVTLVQRANMSKRTVGNEQGEPRKTDNCDTNHDYMY
ncbi:unnamed protein product [Thlaspi arvense]|uniref:Protein kinase domain-containing protein n=1 Tax=Thlaspi arvense TaxID=13288 RepID=A0AAU9T5Y2_THLAR|nr:unnamed protein product [Thlaspi arvense]